jgi:hypothetical protein
MKSICTNTIKYFPIYVLKIAALIAERREDDERSVATLAS